jgi:hypothetical protein
MNSLRLEEEQKAVLFLQKKHQKNSRLMRAFAPIRPKPPVNKSFLLLFFKKEVLACLFLCSAPAYADALRPAIAAPLQAAERYLSEGEYGMAEKKLAQAEAVPGKSADESFTIGQVRAAIDSGRHDYAAAASDYAALIGSGELGPDQVSLMAEAEASDDYQAGDYGGAIRTIKAYLPGDPRFTPILLQSYLKTNDCAALDAYVSRQARPAEANLQMAAYCDATIKNDAAYQAMIEKLVRYYPSPAYWTQLLGLAQSNPAFSDQLALDFFRLKLAAGVAGTEPEYMDMAQTALQGGLPNEAAKIMAQGFATGVLGSGPDAARQARLKALVQQRQTAAAPVDDDAASKFLAGFNQVDGGNSAGLGPMADAIRSGDLAQPGQAELELGIAYDEAGQTANAKAMFAAVQGGGGAADLARLWCDLK